MGAALSAGASAASLVYRTCLGYAELDGEWYAYDRRVLDVLGLSPPERIARFVHIGRPAKPPEDREQPNLNALVAVSGFEEQIVRRFNLYVMQRAHAPYRLVTTPPALFGLLG
jgi:hypothetical protein